MSQFSLSWQETDELEDEKANIQNDIANLMKEKERLEFILAAHKPICKIPADLDIALPAMSVSPAHSCSSTTTTTEVSMQTQTSPVSVASCTSTAHPQVFTSTSNSIFSNVTVPSTTAGPNGAVRLTDLNIVVMDTPTLEEFSTEALEESLELLTKVEMETVRSVPEVDLSSSLYTTQDWEPLYTTAGSNDFESLCTPVVTCTPSLTTGTYTSSFAFTYPEPDAFPTCAVAHRRGSNSNDQSSDSLSSPTLLAL